MMKSDGTFEEDIACIVPQQQGRGAIFVSNIEVALNPLTLKSNSCFTSTIEHKIEAVITAIKGKNLSNQIPKHIEYLYIPVVDHESNDISVFFKDSYDFINEERKRTNVLVHCMAGVSRSVTLVIAYIMQKSKIPFQLAYDYVKSKRNIIHPNDSFIRQLKQLEVKLNLTSKEEQDRTVENSKNSVSLKNSQNSAKNLLIYKERPSVLGKIVNVQDKQLEATSSSFKSGIGCRQESRPKAKGQQQLENTCQPYQRPLQENSRINATSYDQNLRQNIRQLFRSINSTPKTGTVLR